MAGRRITTVKAVPVSIRFKESGYELAVKIVEGPANMLDRFVKVVFTAEQLDKIGEWEPSELLSHLWLEDVSIKKD